MPKPVKKKKKFIRKKEATTYRLIPGYVDDDEENITKNETPEEIQARKEEEKKFGIFYDDYYNYMKHLRSLDEQASLVSTESFRVGPDDEVRSTISKPPVFMEFFSTDIAEETNIDPDILAALDEAPVVKVTEEDEVDDAGLGDDFLDDDFILKAGGAIPVVDLDHDSEGSFISDEEEDDDFEEEESGEEDDDDFIVSDEDDISDRLSSSKPSQGRGNREDDIAEAQTALILKNFEEGLGFRCSNQFSDEEDEMPTAEDYENLKRILKKDKFQQQTVSWSEVLDDKSERPKVDTSKYLYEDVDEFEWKDAPPSKPSFDCVSILSLNSNTRNLPTDLIPKKTQSKKKQQHSVGDTESTSGPGMTLSQLEAEMRESRKADRASTFRPKDESVEEKKARKKAVKEERKERRQEKKANKEVFAMENEKMKKEAASLAKSVRSVKIC